MIDWKPYVVPAWPACLVCRAKAGLVVAHSISSPTPYGIPRPHPTSISLNSCIAARLACVFFCFFWMKQSSGTPFVKFFKVHTVVSIHSTPPK